MSVFSAQFTLIFSWLCPGALTVLPEISNDNLKYVLWPFEQYEENADLKESERIVEVILFLYYLYISVFDSQLIHCFSPQRSSAGRSHHLPWFHETFNIYMTFTLVSNNVKAAAQTFIVALYY